jgi:hypothetical protein
MNVSKLGVSDFTHGEIAIGFTLISEHISLLRALSEMG